MKAILAAIGLAALAAGCDSKETFAKAECTVNGVPLRIEYDRYNSWHKDKVHFYFGAPGSNRLEGDAWDINATFTCDDGRILNYENGDVFWGPKRGQ